MCRMDLERGLATVVTEAVGMRSDLGRVNMLYDNYVDHVVDMICGKTEQYNSKLFGLVTRIYNEYRMER